MMSHKGMASIK